MDLREFDEVLAELRSFYGEAGYAPRMVTMLCEMLLPLTKTEGISVVHLLAQDMPRLPTLAQIRIKALPLLQRAWAREKDAKIRELSKGSPCHSCDLSGVIFALSKEDNTLEYSFGCPHCVAYKVRGLKHPKMWTDELKKDFIPMSIRLESIQAGEKLRQEAFAKERTVKKKIDDELNATKKRVADMLKSQASKEEWKSMLNRVKGTKHV